MDSAVAQLRAALPGGQGHGRAWWAGHLLSTDSALPARPAQQAGRAACAQGRAARARPGRRGLPRHPTCSGAIQAALPGGQPPGCGSFDRTDSSRPSWVGGVAEAGLHISCWLKQPCPPVRHSWRACPAAGRPAHQPVARRERRAQACGPRGACACQAMRGRSLCPRAPDARRAGRRRAAAAAAEPTGAAWWRARPGGWPSRSPAWPAGSPSPPSACGAPPSRSARAAGRRSPGCRACSVSGWSRHQRWGRRTAEQLAHGCSAAARPCVRGAAGAPSGGAGAGLTGARGGAQVAFGEDGAPGKALQGFCRKAGVPVEAAVRGGGLRLGGRAPRGGSPPSRWAARARARELLSAAGPPAPRLLTRSAEEASPCWTSRRTIYSGPEIQTY